MTHGGSRLHDTVALELEHSFSDFMTKSGTETVMTGAGPE